MRTLKKLMALFVCLNLVLSVLFSVSFISHEAGHDCAGEGCQICAIIGKMSDILENLATAISPIAILGALFFCVTSSFTGGFFELVSETPVRLKVKLSD